MSSAAATIRPKVGMVSGPRWRNGIMKWAWFVYKSIHEAHGGTWSRANSQDCAKRHPDCKSDPLREREMTREDGQEFHENKHERGESATSSDHQELCAARVGGNGWFLMSAPKLV